MTGSVSYGGASIPRKSISILKFVYRINVQTALSIEFVLH